MSEKAQELVVAAAWKALADDLAGGHIQDGKQRRGALAHIIVGTVSVLPHLKPCCSS